MLADDFTTNIALFPYESSYDAPSAESLELFCRLLESKGFRDLHNDEWVPVGNVGPLLVLGSATADAPSKEFPDWLFPLVRISTKFRDSAAEAVRNLMQGRSYELAIEDPRREPGLWTPETIPPFSDHLGVARYLLENLPLRSRDHSMLSDWLEDGKEDLDILPSGYEDAFLYLTGQIERLIDIRDISLPEIDKAGLPVEILESHRAVIIGEDDDAFYIARPGASASDFEFQDSFLAALPGERTKVSVVEFRIPADQADTTFSRVERGSATTKVYGDLVDDGDAHRESRSMVLDADELETFSPARNDATPEMILHWVANEAIKKGASDIHMDPFRGKCRVRIRVDGVLITLIMLDLQAAREIGGVITTQAGLSLKVQQARDGKFSISRKSRIYDVRVNSMMDVDGLPGFTLRLLDSKGGSRSLDDFNIRPDVLELIRNLCTNPQGMIISSGPTGSGKSTTLNAILEELNVPEVNIMTVEDPVEYRIEGVRQAQVNKAMGFTFASVLRALLRSDPDIILVGEMRDQETAETAANAALTGHLVLSTLHALSAAGCVRRLVDMGVPSYMLTDSLLMLQAQRLVPKLCDRCKSKRKVDPAAVRYLEKRRPVFEKAGVELPVDLASRFVYEECGCDRCYQRGNQGRVSVMEVVPVTQEIRRLISEKASTLELRQEADDEGFLTLEDEGMLRYLQGEISWKTYHDELMDKTKMN